MPTALELGRMEDRGALRFGGFGCKARGWSCFQLHRLVPTCGLAHSYSRCRWRRAEIGTP
jgi:hypothetical protein